MYVGLIVFLRIWRYKYHKVEICNYEEWQRRGFTFDPETDTKEEMDRVIEMSTGSAFRA